ncbi:MAG: hypothetical protein JW882_14975 [Deltaproteobacteria bacterium]|nr:hypothetical protein [Deltaproteobacteria bacterium]
MGTSVLDAALRAIDEFGNAFHARDVERMAKTCNFPHVRLAGATMAIWHDTEEFLRARDIGGIPLEPDWHHSQEDTRNVVQSSSEKVHVTITFSRFNAAGEKISSFETLYVVTMQEGHWGVQLRSSFAP